MPVTVTVYEPALPVQDSVEVPDVPRVTLVGVRVQVRPVLGETAEVRATVPANPCRDATVIVEVAAEPARTVAEVGLAVTEKSCTLNVTVAV